jgi:eukaryotic-like serine/threonine-protein kinase
VTTTPELLRRAEEILFRVAALPEGERARVVEQACRGEPALASEVASLLAHAGRLGAFLEESALGTDFKLLPAIVRGGAAPDDMPGRTVGHWRIERRIASGGMGTVYLAQRADGQFTQRVAIKIVKRGMDSDEILRRFRAERQTLAALDHPNIARLLDGGATETGQPYLVMEYVEGEPIDEFCDRRRLGNVERLRLFLVVCDAVRYAHQNLVVHRDLKPGNILVTADGTPKLLDFGIATVIASGAPAHATSAQERRLTPEYASPEQVAGRAVATTSDVYSLGVILYELLTGHRPYQFPTRTPAEIERVVVDGPPATAPSDVVMRSETRRDPGRSDDTTITPGAVSSARAATPSQLRRRLRGDLDTIVLAALRKEPERRYASVEQLASDLRLHLQGLPVSARKDTFVYRASKFVRRHAVATTLAALSVLLLAGGVAAFAWQARVASRQRDEAFVARDQSEAITAFLQDMLAAADPAQRGDDVTVHEVLDEAASRLDTELAAQPLVQAHLLSTIGRTYLTLGLYAEAERELRQAHAQRLALLGPHHHDVAESMADLAALLYARRSFDEAEALLRGALDIFRDVRGLENADEAKTLSSLGAVLRAQGRLQEAESVQRRSLEIRRAVAGPDSLDVAESLNNLAGVLIGQRRFEDAEPALTEALDIRRARLGEDHPLVAQTIDNLAVLLHHTGALERAEPLYREALALEKELLGESHPDVAVTQHSLAILLLARGDLAGAEELLAASLATREQTLAPDDARLVMGRLDLAEVLASRGDWDAAEPLLEASAAAVQDGADTEFRAAVLGRAAQAFEEHGDGERAAELRALLE